MSQRFHCLLITTVAAYSRCWALLRLRIQARDLHYLVGFVASVKRAPLFVCGVTKRSSESTLGEADTAVLLSSSSDVLTKSAATVGSGA